jgi:hypothetical protein
MKKLPLASSEESIPLSPRTRRAAVSYFLIGLFLAITGLLILVFLNYFAPFIILMVIFVISIGMFLITAILLKTNPIIMVVLIASGLAILSFAYQPLGPEYRIVGTECRPILDCYRPVRGGGFPAQYVIDNPGITFWGELGFEDEFRVWPIVLDLCFYVCLVELIRRIIRYLSARGLNFKARAG